MYKSGDAVLAVSYFLEVCVSRAMPYLRCRTFLSMYKSGDAVLAVSYFLEVCISRAMPYLRCRTFLRYV